MTNGSDLDLLLLQRDLAIRLAEGEDIDSASILSLQTALQASQMDCGAVFLLDHSTNELYFQAMVGFSPEFVNIVERFPNSSDRWDLVIKGKPYYTTYDQLPIKHNPLFVAEGIKSIALIPLLRRKRVFGGIFLASHQEIELSRQQKAILESLIAQLGLNIERIRAQELLQTCERQYNDLINLQDALVMVLSLEGKFLFSNSAFQKITDLSSEDVLTKSLEDIFIHENQPEHESLLQTLLKNDQTELTMSIKRTGDLPSLCEMRFQIGMWEYKNALIGYGHLLKAEEKRLSAISPQDAKYLLDIFPVPTLVLNPVSLALYHGNREFQRIFGYADFENVEVNFLQLFTDDEYIRLIDVLRRKGLLGLKDTSTWVQKCKSGEQITTRLSMHAVRWNIENAVLVVINIDETPVKYSHSIQEERYREVVERQTDLIVRFTVDGMITFVNQAYCDFAQKEADQLIGSYAWNQIHERDMENFRNHLAQITVQSPIRQSQNRMIDGLGQLRTIRWIDRGIFENGRLAEIQGVGRDISEEVSTQILQDTIEQRFKILIEGIQSIVYILHAETLLTIYISPQIEAISGYTPEEVYRDPYFWTTRIHPDDAGNVMNGLQDRINGKTDVIIEYRFFHKDGHIIWAQDRGSKFLSKDGTPLLQGMITDDSTNMLAMEKLAFYSQFERIVNDFSLALMKVKPYQWNDLMENILFEIGSQLGVDRAYLFKVDDEHNSLSNTHEWCADGIESFKDTMQDMDVGLHRWWMEQLYAHGQIIMEELDALPEEAAETRKLLELQSIQSILVVACMREQRICGFIGFDAVKSRKHWEQEAILILRMVSEMVMNAQMRLNPRWPDNQ